MRTLWICLLFVLPGMLRGQTLLDPGDIAILGINANTAACGGENGEDELTFVCFKDIETGTVLDFTDNGYERVFPQLWGNSEGFVRAVRTGPTIPAGTIIRFQLPNIGTKPYNALLPDANWTFQDLGLNSFNFNQGGDQVYVLQGGTWGNGTVLTGFNFRHDARYIGGRILYGFNSKALWRAGQNDPQDSGLHPDLGSCFHMEPNQGSTNYTSYRGSVSDTTQLAWIGRIANADNWQNYPNCQSYTTISGPVGILPSGIKTTCTLCQGCRSFTDTLIFTLPANGGPFQVQLATPSDTLTFPSLRNGDRRPVVVQGGDTLRLLSVQDATGCPVYSNLGPDVIIQQGMPETKNLDTLLCYTDTLYVNGNAYHRNKDNGVEIRAGQSGCDTMLQVQLRFRDPIDLSLAGDSSICKGEMAMLRFQVTGIGVYDVVVNNGSNVETLRGVQNGYTVTTSPIPDPLKPYTVTKITEISSGCTLDTLLAWPIRVSDYSVSLETVQEIRCNDTRDGLLQARVNGTPIGALQYQWSNGDTTASASSLSPGLYTVTVTDALRCTQTASQTLLQPDPLTVNARALDIVCAGGTSGGVYLDSIRGGTMPYRIFLNNNPVTAEQGRLPATLPGNYTLQVQDSRGCRDSSRYLVRDLKQEYFLEIGGDTSIRLGDTLLLDIATNALLDTVSWSPGNVRVVNETRVGLSPDATTIYRLRAITQEGCVLEDAITVSVTSRFPWFAPTAFSPNGDGTNDFFTLYGDDRLTQIRQLAVFDRWGNRVFWKDSLQPGVEQVGWAGDNRPVGTYVYTAILEFKGGQTRKVAGEVLLMR